MRTEPCASSATSLPREGSSSTGHPAGRNGSWTGGEVPGVLNAGEDWLPGLQDPGKPVRFWAAKGVNLYQGIEVTKRIIGCMRETHARAMARKRIYNPVTGKYYELRQRSSVNGEAGQIKGLWTSKRKTEKKA